jgi:hypothetical protein
MEQIRRQLRAFKKKYRCHDNSIVTLVSNCHSISPIGKVVERVGFIERRKGKIQVDCPTVVMKYTKYMGELTDLTKT